VFLRYRSELPAQGEGLRNGRQAIAYHGDIDGGHSRAERDTHKKALFRQVVILLRFQDIGTQFEERHRNAGYDPGAIDT
jgi:hypothetical protein